MSEEKLYAVKNDDRYYWDFNSFGFWRRELLGCFATTSKERAEIVAKEHGGHVVTLIEEPKKVVLTKEQAEIVEDAHVDEYPATYISDNTTSMYDCDESLLMNAYVNGYTVAKETKYYVKVFKNDFGYLNINYVTGRSIASGREQELGYRTQFTKSEIKQLEQRDDIPLDWDKVKLIEVDDKEIIDGESDF